jgi:hypothetical protein
MEKVYLDEGLWYIENFLKENELSLLKKYCDDPNHWYTTMRSPYKNILNKWPMSEPRYDEDGTLAIPNQDDPVIEEVFNIFSGPEGIFERLRSVLPEGYAPNSGIQTFKYCTDEEIKRDRDESMSLGNAEMFAVRSNPDSAEDIDYAMDWHWEDTGATGSRIASHSIYLNDDFEGGYIEFKKGYIVKPKAGMLINIPIGKEFTHRVTKVLGPNSRHTLYGQCWSDNNIVLSTKDDC